MLWIVIICVDCLVCDYFLVYYFDDILVLSNFVDSGEGGYFRIDDLILLFFVCGFFCDEGDLFLFWGI